MNKMESVERVLEPESSSIEDLIEKIMLWIGEAFLFIGFFGFFMFILYPKLYNDEILQYSMSFFYSYIMILGIFLILYHGKIIVRGYRT